MSARLVLCVLQIHMHEGGRYTHATGIIVWRRFEAIDARATIILSADSRCMCRYAKIDISVLARNHLLNVLGWLKHSSAPPRGDINLQVGRRPCMST